VEPWWVRHDQSRGVCRGPFRAPRHFTHHERLRSRPWPGRRRCGFFDLFRHHSRRHRRRQSCHEDQLQDLPANADRERWGKSPGWQMTHG